MRINDNISGESKANKAHFEMGCDIRKFIIDNGVTMPEDLSKPEKSLKEIEKENPILINNK